MGFSTPVEWSVQEESPHVDGVRKDLLSRTPTPPHPEESEHDRDAHPEP
jgi:hypothetical protein